MDVIYNTKGIGDTLMIPFKDGKRYDINTESFGDITKITGEADEILGYNIANASKHFEITETDTGKFKLDDNLLQKIEAFFKENGLTDSLKVDLSPKFVVGHVLSKEAHENADKLSVCKIDVGTETLQIVCGAPNIDAGQKVVVAKIGATMPSGLKIKPTELRGVPSNGMVCSQQELGLPDAPAEKGIYVLSDSEQVGKEFKF